MPDGGSKNLPTSPNMETPDLLNFGKIENKLYFIHLLINTIPTSPLLDMV